MEKIKLKGYDFYKAIGSPKFICAPMVNQSELAFRLLVKKYNCQLSYSPMYNSKMLNDTYKKKMFSTSSEDRPLFVQLCGNDPQVVLKASKYFEQDCDAIDLNLGCPQGIARKGNYGSFLLSNPDLIVSIVELLDKELKIPVTCKIRILDDKEKTLELARKIQKAGASILTVHGRTKEQNKDKVGQADWDIIKQIKEELTIPVFCNGGIYTNQDVQDCLEYTNCDGVMSSEALLENPSLFAKELQDMDILIEQYLELADLYEKEQGIVKPHLFKMAYQGLKQHTDLRDQLGQAKSISEMKGIMNELKIRRENVNKEDKLGWYLRYCKDSFKNGAGK